MTSAVSDLREFRESGRVVVDLDRVLIDQIRRKVQQCVSSHVVSINGLASRFSDLDRLHELDLEPSQLNDLRLGVIHSLNASELNEAIYRSCKVMLDALVGPDVLVQRSINLVVQPPNDPNPSELHRDAPANSAYEVVVWVPLVDVDATMAMYTLNAQDSLEAATRLATASDWTDFKEYCEKKSALHPIPYGKALLFWTGLFHGSFINSSSRTRVSLNVRFKSAGTPFGSKDPLQFFRVLTLSPLTELGLQFESKRS